MWHLQPESEEEHQGLCGTTRGGRMEGGLPLRPGFQERHGCCKGERTAGNASEPEQGCGVLTALGASLGQSSMSRSPRLVVTTTFPAVGGSRTYTEDMASHTPLAEADLRHTHEAGPPAHPRERISVARRTASYSNAALVRPLSSLRWVSLSKSQQRIPQEGVPLENVPLSSLGLCLPSPAVPFPSWILAHEGACPGERPNAFLMLSPYSQRCTT